jgi:hypothetical protein
LIHSTDVRSSRAKVVFIIIKECNCRNYTDGNSALACDMLKNKFDPVSVPSLVKTERAFRKRKLEKEEDPEIWITNLEELRLKQEDMESHKINSQFMVRVLTSLTNDYELQMVLMEKRIRNRKNPLTIDELEEELILRPCLRPNSRISAETAERWAIRQQIARLDVRNSRGLRLKLYAATARSLAITRLNVSSDLGRIRKQ